MFLVYLHSKVSSTGDEYGSKGSIRVPRDMGFKPKQNQYIFKIPTEYSYRHPVLVKPLIIKDKEKIHYCAYIHEVNKSIKSDKIE